MQTKARRTDNKLTVETRIQTVPEDESFLLDDADDQLDYETENDENNGMLYNSTLDWEIFFSFMLEPSQKNSKMITSGLTILTKTRA